MKALCSYPIGSSAAHVLCAITAGVFGVSTLKNVAADEAPIFAITVEGAKPDGSGDSTAAIQKSLDEAGRAGGSVDLPAGRYLVAGSLRIPPGVTLQGVMESPVWSAPLKGSVILATGGRGQEDGRALFELGHSSAVRGLTVWYPQQQTTNLNEIGERAMVSLNEPVESK